MRACGSLGAGAARVPRGRDANPADPGRRCGGPPVRRAADALDADLLPPRWIAPEHFLKRCLVGGFDEVFELNQSVQKRRCGFHTFARNLRCWRHIRPTAPTTIPPSSRARDYSRSRRRGDRYTEGCHCRMAAILRVDGEWQTIQMYPSLSEALGEEITRRHRPGSVYWQIADRLGCGDSDTTVVTATGNWSRNCGSTPSANKLWAPTFVRDFPVETTPLTRSHRSIRGRHREVGSVHPTHRVGHRLLRAHRPGYPTRKVRSAGSLRPPRAMTRQWLSTRIFWPLWSMRCRLLQAPEWVSIGC